MAAALVFVCALLFSVTASQCEIAAIADEDSLSLRWDAENGAILHVEKMKLKISKLEDIADVAARESEDKDFKMRKMEKQIDELTQEISALQNVLLDVKQLPEEAYSRAKVTDLETEVQFLWVASRKNNFDHHVLETEVGQFEERLEESSSQVQKELDIVTEQWIQIQQLEQALQMTQMRISEAQREAEDLKCTFFKILKALPGSYLQRLVDFEVLIVVKNNSILQPYLSQASTQLRSIMTAGQNYHHDLQRSVKRFMEKNEMTAVLVNDELIFFMASTLIVFPLMGIWLIFTSCVN